MRWVNELNMYILIMIPTFYYNSGNVTNNHIPIGTDGDFEAIKIDAFIRPVKYKRLVNPLWI